MIEKLTVKELNRRFNYEFEFYEDLNIFAGTIGSGKTTLLKLIWFLTSGNLHRVIYEIPFQFVSIKTSQFSLFMNRNDSEAVEFRYQFVGEKNGTTFVLDIKQDPSLKQLEELNKRIADVMESSLFFPTFRRIERHIWQDLSNYAAYSTLVDSTLPEISKAFLQLAEELSFENHRFIVAVSTYDIIDVLSRIDARISEDENHVDSESETRDLLWQFLIDYDRKTLVDRWSFLSELVKEIYEYYDGIRFTEDIVLGADMSKDGNLIPSANLSSGEKQLLGFLCYNGFSEAKRTFIDEPELSLHPDWQRLLIDLLEYQGTEKQFFIASHSPYIGMKYEDKKFELKRHKED